MKPTRPTIRRLVAAALAWAVVAALVPSAVAHAPNPVFGGATWSDNQALTFRWRSGSVPPDQIKTAIREAAEDNNATKASRGASFTYAAGGLGLVGYGASATCGVNGIGCFTRSAPDGFTMWLREHRRVFDWGVLRWCQMEADPTNGCYDAETIALDEFGHIQILNHHVNFQDASDYLDSVVQTFSRTRPAAGWNQHRYGRCDTAALQLRYDTPNASAPYSTCLDVGTVLALSASPTSIAYGGTTKLTAVLKVTATDGYLRLRSNPITGRVVKLQRRPPGASAWTTVATMATTTSAGTYATSLKLQTDAEFRAVFTAPDTEGLRSDTSPTVRVDVAACTGSCPLSAPADVGLDGPLEELP